MTWLDLSVKARVGFQVAELTPTPLANAAPVPPDPVVAPGTKAPVPDVPNRLEVVSKDPVADAERILRSFMRRAFRRAVSDDDVKPFLGIPEELDVLAIIPFGYPPKAIGKGKKNRKPLSEVAHRGRFGQPFQYLQEVLLDAHPGLHPLDFQASNLIFHGTNVYWYLY